MKELADIIALARTRRIAQAALATVVRIEGSAYRRPGASLLLDAEGRRLGSVSGGCLERDVESHAKTVLATGQPRLVTYDTRDDADIIFGTALGCGGLVEVFIERIDLLDDTTSPVARWSAAADRRETLAELLIIAAPSASPLSAGERAWLTLGPLSAPSTSEGRATAAPARAAHERDERARDIASKVGANDAARIEVGAAAPVSPAHDDATRREVQRIDGTTHRIEVGLPAPPVSLANDVATGREVEEATGAGSVQALVSVLIAAARETIEARTSAPIAYAAPYGEVRAFVRVIEPPVRLVVCGGGDDAQPLVAMANALGWRVWVLDHRAGFAKPERFPGAERVEVSIAGTLPADFVVDPRTVAMVMNHHYPSDGAWLRTLAALPLTYLGLLGARHRTARLLNDHHLPPAGPGGLEHLYAPAGLDIGGEGPEAIALAMLAEMQAVLAGRRGGPLRDSSKPIQAAAAAATASASTTASAGTTSSAPATPDAPVSPQRG